MDNILSNRNYQLIGILTILFFVSFVRRGKMLITKSWCIKSFLKVLILSFFILRTGYSVEVSLAMSVFLLSSIEYLRRKENFENTPSESRSSQVLLTSDGSNQSVSSSSTTMNLGDSKIIGGVVTSTASVSMDMGSNQDSTFTLRGSTKEDDTTKETVIIICSPSMPDLEITDPNKHVATLNIGKALLDENNSCKTSKSKNIVDFVEGKYILSDVTEKDSTYKIDPVLVDVEKTEPKVFKGYNLIVAKGHKLEMIKKDGSKSTFSATASENGVFKDSQKIFNALRNIESIEASKL